MNNGIEIDQLEQEAHLRSADCETAFIAGQHQRLIQVVLQDETDRNNQLVQEREWLLHPKDAEHLALSGNLFAVESPITGAGKVFVKCAPLPNARESEGTVDFSVKAGKGGFEYLLHNTGPSDLEHWQVLDYDGGAVGRTRVLHNWQRSLRPQTDVHRVPRFISNSWGDRNRDARIQHDFMLKEINAAARLGVEVVQIDDGWQKGISANSHVAKEQGGVWHGFWDADPEFWTPHPGRFPQGLEPILKRAAEKSVEIGLWYAPDSSNEFANWRRDADQVLKLHRDFRVNHFKLDSISAATIAARRNLRAMLKAVIDESHGRIVCDIDVTAGVRPGYFGEMAAGTLFVENRYTDWHNYWPHCTLRNLWQLSRWIDPRRLRMEFLNNSRNTSKYEGDSLAPALYPPSTLFAITMFANPLGWFENTGLPADYVTDAARLVRTWREHRAAIVSGDICPIGEAPDGAAWTGFCSAEPGSSSAYVLVFNERSSSQEHAFHISRSFESADVLSGPGKAAVERDRLLVEMKVPFSYILLKLQV